MSAIVRLRSARRTPTRNGSVLKPSTSGWTNCRLIPEFNVGLNRENCSVDSVRPAFHRTGKFPPYHGRFWLTVVVAARSLVVTDDAVPSKTFVETRVRALREKKPLSAGIKTDRAAARFSEAI